LPVDVHAFADLWEHVRLLSDPRRNAALLELLRRRAPGARVLEVGCGTGLLSCVAARLGARRVVAVEPTAQVEVARALVAANGLQRHVEVLEGTIEELVPEPVDLVFGELLNADPFAEGLLDAFDAAARWVAPGGHLAPHTLRLHAALTAADDSADEVATARRELTALASAHELDLSPLLDGLATLEPYASLTPRARALGPATEVLRLPLGSGERPPDELPITLPRGDLPRVRGVVLWFEADLDEGLVLDNVPRPDGPPDHWGQLVLGLPEETTGDHASFVLHLSDGEVALQAGPRSA
jgi:protein-L-isoaspartate O-methyltransferase